MVNSAWDVFVIEFARSKDQPVDSLVQGAHEAGVIDLPFSFVVARSGDRVVLVDTGFMKEGIGADMSEKFAIPYWISPLTMLNALDIAPGEVTDIVLSHAHFDHMGSVSKFPNAQIYIQKRAWLSWMEAMALPRQFGFLTLAINPDDLRAGFDASVEHRMTLLDGDTDDVLPGIHVRTGEGHTLGQQFILIDSPRGRLVISGDCVYAATNLCGHRGDGVYVPLAFGVGSIWEQLKTMDRINGEIEQDLSRLIILHDTERWAHLPIVTEIDGFRIHKAS